MKLQNFENKLKKMHLSNNMMGFGFSNQDKDPNLPDIGSYGNFKFNDVPNRILFVDLVRNFGNHIEVLCTIEWKKRKNGFKPKNSVSTNTVLKYKCPYLLLDFYESKIKGISKNIN